MATIIWDENKPAGQDSLGLGDDEIRSLKTALRTGLGTEHVWPSTGGDAGVHLIGSARAFVGTQSLVSSAGTDGRLMVTSDTSRFFHVGSAGTMFLGGQQSLMVNGSNAFLSPALSRYYWAMDVGAAAIDPTGVTRCFFSDSGFSGIPITTVTVLNATPLVPVITGFATTYVDVSTYDLTGNLATGTNVWWQSVGSRAL